MTDTAETVIANAAGLAEFIDASPSPYHACETVAQRLRVAGYTELAEADAWTSDVQRCFLRRAGSLIAWNATGTSGRGFRIVGAHTDSPNLRLKPQPEYQTEGYAQLGVEVYGGALLNSWLDRDLGLAGRVLVRGEDGAIASRLVRIDRPLLRIPQLAIHLDREVNDKGLVLNRQDHLAPVLGLATTGRAALGQLVADAAQVAPDLVLGTELMLFDLAAPSLGGQNDEFVFSARLDNLAMCHAALSAIVRASASSSIAIVALFDHEEVGSDSAGGAGSAVLPRLLERLLPDREAFHQACARSSCVSADMAHAVHPNYAGRHEPRHKPQLNGGPVIKTNTQQRYATTAATAAMFANLCRDEDVPVQHYAHRTDLPCGSTIGPITSTLLGIPTVDVGNPMLSMHSAREMAGSRDPELMTRVLARYLQT